ncbi:MAG: metallophosphoesterase family protein [Bacillota bacterium]
MLSKNKVKIEPENYDNLYVISDIHAHCELLQGIIDEINLTKDDLLIIAGDSCDRGPETAEVYEEIIALKEEGYNLIHLLGNHEQMFFNAVVFGIDHSLWMRNGGQLTLDSYQGRKELQEKHLDFIEAMPMVVETDDYLIVHAGLDPNKPISEQEIEDLLWSRSQFLRSDLEVNKTIVFGHTITKTSRIYFYSNNTIGIDCGSYKNNKVGALELKTKQEFYVKTKERK